MTTCHRSLDRLDVRIHANGVHVAGELAVPSSALGVVVFAHGSGSTRHSPRNQSVAHALNGGGLATLLFDLLTANEALADAADGHLRFDITFLASRLESAIDWVSTQPVTHTLKIGAFGASTGAGAALITAAENVPTPCRRSCLAVVVQTSQAVGFRESRLPRCSRRQS